MERKKKPAHLPPPPPGSRRRRAPAPTVSFGSSAMGGSGGQSRRRSTLFSPALHPFLPGSPHAGTRAVAVRSAPLGMRREAEAPCARAITRSGSLPIFAQPRDSMGSSIQPHSARLAGGDASAGRWYTPSTRRRRAGQRDRAQHNVE